MNRSFTKQPTKSNNKQHSSANKSDAGRSYPAQTKHPLASVLGNGVAEVLPPTNAGFQIPLQTTKSSKQSLVFPKPKPHDLMGDLTDLVELHKDQSILDQGEQLLKDSLDKKDAQQMRKLHEKRGRLAKTIEKLDKRVKSRAEKFTKPAEKTRKKAEDLLKKLQKKAKDDKLGKYYMARAFMTLSELYYTKNTLLAGYDARREKVNVLIDELNEKKKAFNAKNQEIKAIKDKQFKALQQQENKGGLSPAFIALRQKYFSKDAKQQKGAFIRKLPDALEAKSLDGLSMTNKGDYMRTGRLVNNKVQALIHGTDQVLKSRKIKPEELESYVDFGQQTPEFETKKQHTDGLNDLILKYEKFLNTHNDLLTDITSHDLDKFKKFHRAYLENKAQGKDKQVVKEAPEEKVHKKQPQDIARILLKAFLSPDAAELEMNKHRAKYSLTFEWQNFLLQDKTLDQVKTPSVEELQAIIQYAMTSSLDNEDKMHLVMFIMKFIKNEVKLSKVFGNKFEDTQKVDVGEYKGAIGDMGYKRGKGKGKYLEKKSPRSEFITSFLEQHYIKDKPSVFDHLGLALRNHGLITDFHQGISAIMQKKIVDPANKRKQRRETGVIPKYSPPATLNEKKLGFPKPFKDTAKNTRKAVNDSEQKKGKLTPAFDDAKRADDVLQDAITEATRKKIITSPRDPDKEFINPSRLQYLREEGYWQYYSDNFLSNPERATEAFGAHYRTKSEFLNALTRNGILQTPYQHLDPSVLGGNGALEDLDPDKIHEGLRDEVIGILAKDLLEATGYKSYLSHITNKFGKNPYIIGTLASGLAATIWAMRKELFVPGNFQPFEHSTLIPDVPLDFLKMKFWKHPSSAGGFSFDKNELSHKLMFGKQDFAGESSLFTNYPCTGAQLYRRTPMAGLEGKLPTSYLGYQLAYERLVNKGGKTHSHTQAKLYAMYKGILPMRFLEKSQLNFGKKEEDLFLAPEQLYLSRKLGIDSSQQYKNLKLSGNVEMISHNLENPINFLKTKLGIDYKQALAGGQLAAGGSYNRLRPIGGGSSILLPGQAPLANEQTWDVKLSYNRNQAFNLKGLNINAKFNLSKDTINQLNPVFTGELGVDWKAKLIDLKATFQYIGKSNNKSDFGILNITPPKTNIRLTAIIKLGN